MPTNVPRLQGKKTKCSTERQDIIIMLGNETDRFMVFLYNWSLNVTVYIKKCM